MDPIDIIHAAQNPAMNTYTVQDARETLRASIDKAYRLAEVQLPNAVEYEQLVESVTDKIMRSYPYITSQEFYLVIESGVAGELGGRTKPSAAAFFGWLAQYVASDVRKEAIRNYRRSNAADPATRLRTPSEIAELNRQAEARAIRSLWAEYKANGRILETEHLRGYVAMAMDGLAKRRIFDITDEHWAIAREEAKHNRHRLMRGALGFMGAAPDVPDSVLKWTMLEMCFEGQLATGRDLVINA